MGRSRRRFAGKRVTGAAVVPVASWSALPSSANEGDHGRVTGQGDFRYWATAGGEAVGYWIPSDLYEIKEQGVGDFGRQTVGNHPAKVQSSNGGGTYTAANMLTRGWIDNDSVLSDVSGDIRVTAPGAGGKDVEFALTDEGDPIPDSHWLGIYELDHINGGNVNACRIFFAPDSGGLNYKTYRLTYVADNTPNKVGWYNGSFAGTGFVSLSSFETCFVEYFIANANTTSTAIGGIAWSPEQGRGSGAKIAINDGQDLQVSGVSPLWRLFSGVNLNERFDVRTAMLLRLR